MNKLRTQRPDHNGNLKPVEDHSFAPPEFHAPWDHVPVPPYRGQVYHESLNPVLTQHEVYDSLYTVMERISSLFVPPKFGYVAMVLDEGFNVVFGYSATSVQAAIGEIEWYGVQVAFQQLESLARFDMIDLAIWEAAAQRRAT